MIRLLIAAPSAVVRAGLESLVVSSLEVDFWPMARGGIAFFTDAGNAMQHFDLTTLEYSIGAGIRYLSPPPISVDLMFTQRMETGSSVATHG